MSSKIRHFLEVAGRDTTNENEALNAVRALKTALAREGMSFTDIHFIKGIQEFTPVAPRTLGLPTSGLQKQVRELTDEVTKLREKCERLEAENERLTRENRAYLIASGEAKKNEVMTWEEYAVLAQARLGITKGWRAAVAQQMDIRQDRVSEWASNNKVPPSAVRFLHENLEPVVKETTPSNEVMSIHEDEIVQELIDTGMSQRAALDAFKERTGKLIRQSSIKMALRRHRLRLLALSLWDAGVEDQDEIVKNVQARDPTLRVRFPRFVAEALYLRRGAPFPPGMKPRAGRWKATSGLPAST